MSLHGFRHVRFLNCLFSCVYQLLQPLEHHSLLIGEKYLHIHLDVNFRDTLNFIIC